MCLIHENCIYTIYVKHFIFFLDMKLSLHLKIHCVDYSVMECTLHYENIDCKFHQFLYTQTNDFKVNISRQKEMNRH